MPEIGDSVFSGLLAIITKHNSYPLESYARPTATYIKSKNLFLGYVFYFFRSIKNARNNYMRKNEICYNLRERKVVVI